MATGQEVHVRPRSLFNRLAAWTARITGRPATFLFACAVIVGWAAMGPALGFSDTWQLVINTGTTIATFLMVFLIQNTQNRDATAVQVKLDEIIRALGSAKNELLDLEELEDDDLDQLRRHYRLLATKARRAISARRRRKRSVEQHS